MAAPVAVPRVEVAAVVMASAMVVTAAVVVTPVEAVAAAMIETALTTMGANLVRAVVKVETPVHAMPDSQGVAVLRARRLLGAEQGTHQQ